MIFALTTFTVTYLSEHEVLLLVQDHLGVVSVASAFLMFGCWGWFFHLWMSGPPHKYTAFFERLLERAFGSVGRILSGLIFSIVVFWIVGAISIRLGLIL